MLKAFTRQLSLMVLYLHATVCSTEVIIIINIIIHHVKKCKKL